MEFCVFRSVSLVVLLLFFQSCEDNEVLGLYPEKESIYQKGFSLEAFEDPIIREYLAVDWFSPEEFKDADGTILYEFPAQVGNGPALEGQSLTLAQKYSVVVPKVMDGSPLEYKLVRFLSNNNESLIPISYHNKSNFTGTVYYYDLKGRTEKLEGYNEGVLKAVSRDTGKSETSLAARAPKDCLPDDPYCDGGFFVYEPVRIYKDWYNNRGNKWEYSNSTYVKTVFTQVWVPSNIGGAPRPAQNYHEHIDAPAPHAPGGTGHASNHPVEIIKDPSFIGTKADCVYTKLLKTSDGFKNTIKKFDGEFPVAHLKFEIDPNMASNTKKAYTTPPTDYIINIVLNGNSTKDASYQKRPNLLVAKTIIHEVIHAEMWRKILSIIDNGGNVQGITRQQWIDKLSNGDYPGIFDYYTRFGVNGFQHPQMAANYRDVIADGLESFDNNSHPSQFYKDLAWEGLIYSNDPTWISLSSSEKTRIKSTINNYFNQKINENRNK